MDQKEYWRFYQSGQFLFLQAVREYADLAWRDKLRRDSLQHFSRFSPEQIEQLPGFISFLNTIYTLSEYFEFGARMGQAGVYAGATDITVELHGIKGFVLTTDSMRAWWLDHQCTVDHLGHTWSTESSELIANSAQFALQAMVWFFERFNWTNVPESVLRDEQEKFLSSKS